VEGMRVLLYLLGSSKNPNARQPLMRVVKGELPLVPPRRNSEAALDLLPFVIVEAMLALILFGMMGFELQDGSGILVGLLIIFAAFVSFFFFKCRTQIPHKEQSSLRVAACESLRMLCEKKAIPTLLAASQGEERDVAEAAKIALYSLLPTLDATDTDWLPMDARRQLATLLHQREPEMVLPVLRAMEFIGAEVAIRRIASMMTHGITPTIRAEASRIYPILVERQRQEKISGTLLRASQPPPYVQGELLRPVASHFDPTPQQLLRASNGQDESR